MYNDTQRVSILTALDELRVAVEPPQTETSGAPHKALAARPLHTPPGPTVRLCRAIEALALAQAAGMQHHRTGKARHLQNALEQIRAAARHVALSLKATAAGQ